MMQAQVNWRGKRLDSCCCAGEKSDKELGRRRSFSPTAASLAAPPSLLFSIY